MLSTGQWACPWSCCRCCIDTWAAHKDSGSRWKGNYQGNRISPIAGSYRGIRLLRRRGNSGRGTRPRLRRMGYCRSPFGRGIRCRMGILALGWWNCCFLTLLDNRSRLLRLGIRVRKFRNLCTWGLSWRFDCGRGRLGIGRRRGR